MITKREPLLIMLLLLTLHLGANNNDSDRLTQRVKAIYHEIFAEKENITRNEHYATQKYLSQSFKELYNEVCRWEEKLGEMIYGNSIWGVPQDIPEQTTFSVFDATTKDDTATVCVQLTFIDENFSPSTWNWNTDTLCFIRENGDWYLDDVRRFAYREKEVMKKELSDVVKWWIESR